MGHLCLVVQVRISMADSTFPVDFQMPRGAYRDLSRPQVANMHRLCLSVLFFHVALSIQQSGGSNFNTTSAFNTTLDEAVDATATATTCADCYVRSLAGHERC